MENLAVTCKYIVAFMYVFWNVCGKKLKNNTSVYDL